MANQEKNNPQETPVITEEDILETKTPWWKWALKIASYVATAVAGGVVGLLLGKGSDDDDSDDNSSEEDTEE